MCNLTEDQALKSLLTMIEPQSLAGQFFFAEIDGKVSSLTEAFEKLYRWDRHHTTLDGMIRRWRGLNIGQFKTDESSWPEAMEKFYERAVLLQDQLDEVHKHETLLIEVLQNGIRDQPFYLFVERAESVTAAINAFTIS